MRGVWKVKKHIAPECQPSHYCRKNIWKMHDLELIRGSRLSPGSRLSSGSSGSGVRECGSDPPFHTRREPGWRQSNKLPQMIMPWVHSLFTLYGSCSCARCPCSFWSTPMSFSKTKIVKCEKCNPRPWLWPRGCCLHKSAMMGSQPGWTWARQKKTRASLQTNLRRYMG